MGRRRLGLRSLVDAALAAGAVSHAAVLAAPATRGALSAVRGLVAAGLGVSILPASFKRVQLREMRWVTIAEEDAVSEMWLVWSKHREQSHAAQRFKQQLMSASAGRHFHGKEGKNVR